MPYMPTQDADLDAFAQNMNTLITANPTNYGLIAGQATTFDTAADLFTSTLATATNPSTRTSVTVAAKNSARAALKTLIQNYMAIIQAYPAITNPLLSGLGLTVRDTVPTPIPAPTSAPILSFQSSSSFAIFGNISDENTPDLRARPFGAIGAEIWVKVGVAAPASPAETAFKQLTTRQPTVVQFTGGDAGETCYAYARWINRRGEPGPWSALAQFVIAG